MFHFIGQFLYNLFTSSGVVFYFLPFLHLLGMTNVPTPKTPNHMIEDDGGSKIGVTKINGKLYPAFGEKRLQSIKNIRVRSNDVFLCGYPKTGCHWTFEILRMLLTKKLRFSRNGKAFEGMIDMCPDFLLDSLPSPRVLNSHLWYNELPTDMKDKKNKIILTIRSPKDTVVSFYNHNKNLVPLYSYDGKFENYFKLFTSGNLEYGSYFDFYLDWQKTMMSQADNQILVVRYEDLKENTVDTIMEMVKFLDLEIDQQFAHEVARACDFNVMKTKRSKDLTAPLFRKGVVGDWRNWLTLEQSRQMDAIWRDKMAESIYVNTDVTEEKNEE